MALDLQQQEARDTINTNILVSASAGAGKTSVLVARLVKRCLNDEIPIQRIVALTFTKAAAEEMKARLSKSFREELLHCTESKKAYIQEQIVALEDADILTIDSYCLKLVKKYYTVIGLDPITATQILDAGSSSRLQHMAFLQALQEFYEERKEETENLVTYFSARSEDYSALESTILSIQNHANSCFNVQEFYTNAKAKYHPVRHLKEIDSDILNAFFDEKKLQVETIFQLVQEMQVASVECDQKHKDQLAAFYNNVVNTQQSLDEQNYPLFLGSLEYLLNSIPSTFNKALAYTELAKKVSSMVKELCATSCSEQVLVQDCNELIPYAHTLLDLANRCQTLFAQSKLKEKAIDFTDMERFLLDILQANDYEVAKVLQGSYDEIMVDEFQDTSVLQNAIIELISNGHNVFRVGDVKQSIYRFRQAKPSLMQNMMQDENQHCIHLKHNFRSRSCVVDFNNTLFSKLMNIEGCKDTYLEDDYQEIGTDRQKENFYPAIFACVEKAEDDKKRTSASLKATWIAQQIIRLHNDGFSFSDMAVLTRNHNNKLALKTAFDTYHIPYDIDTRQGFFNSTLCTDILHIVKTMLDPCDPVALVTTLTSPLYRFDDETLSLLKVHHGSIYKGIHQEYPVILEELQKLKEIADKQGTIPFLEHLAFMHQYYNSLEDNAQTNFDFLMQKIQNSNIEDLYALKVFLETGTDEKSSEAVSKGKQDDLVRVVTIHQSKGLQYQVVFLFSDNQNTDKDSSSLAQIHDDLYLGLKHIDLNYRVKRETVYSLAISHTANLEDLEEFTRVLYVALTRAVQRIYIVEDASRLKTPVSLSRGSINLRKGMSGLILSAMEEGPLFHIEHTCLTDTDPLPLKTERYTDVLPVYPVTEVLPEMITPSETEFTSIPSLDMQNIHGTSYGTAIHETIEHLPDTTWTKDTLKDLPVSSSDKEKLLHFAQSDIYQTCLLKTIEKEKSFFVIDRQNKTTIKGSMDFVAYDDSQVILIDFKTDNATKEVILQRYKDQLLTYKRALEILFPLHTLTVYAYSFHHECFIEVK